MALPLQTSFDDLSTPLFDVTFCILDLETTGGSARTCEITEIGAVKYRHGDEIGSFQTLVDPGAPIPPSITILTGITHAMVVDAPRIETALPDFLEFIGSAVIVGHNIRFDMSFLNHASERLGYRRIDNATVDTAALARRLVRSEVRNLRLQSLAAHFRSPVTPNHRALADAMATAHVFHGLLERAGTLGVTNIDDLLAMPKARGSNFYRKISMTDGLPRSPGVYLFRDRHANVIYVGKATNLRQRVRQYFYGDTRKSIGNLMRELASVDHQVCPTLLEAEVTELRLIHAHRPRHNRRSRPPKHSHFVRLTGDDFPRLSVVRTVKPDALAHLGPFRSKRSADLVMTALWDAIPIRRCRGRAGSRSGKCAPAQLGVAFCPCDGSLDPNTYGTTVETLIRGLNTDSALLLAPLREKMEKTARAARFEEAAWLRDRHRALARALERRQRWRAVQEAGVLEVLDSQGNHVVVDHGILVASWKGSNTPPLQPEVLHTRPIEEVASSVEIAEEVDLIWRWLEKGGIRLENATGTLALPAKRVEWLEVG
jgi:DNA polymerase III subunit epsilon